MVARAGLQSRFVVFKKAKRWHWFVWLARHGPIAFGRKEGYQSENQARSAARSAYYAMRFATEERPFDDAIAEPLIIRDSSRDEGP